MLDRGSRIFCLALVTGSGFLFAQNQPSRGGWRRAEEPPPPIEQADPQPDRPARPEPNIAQRGPLDQYGSPVGRDGQRPEGPPQQYGPPPSQQQQYGPPPQQQQYGPPPQQQQYGPPPSQLTIRAGTFITVRINQPLSSDHNQPGDAFSATLVNPIVVDGVAVAQRGQTIAGRVAEAQKAGRVEGVSRLGVQLTELTLVDGNQVPLQSQLISRSGGTSVGRDVGAVAGTTALGAAIGAASTWDRGVGAGIGAGAGAAVGLIGVLLTRGHATVIYPEQVLTFRIEAPITVSTERAPQAFQYADPRDYERPPELHSRPGPPPPPYYGGPYYGPPLYPYPYYYGPRVSFFYGSGFYGRGFYGRGFYRGRRW